MQSELDRDLSQILAGLVGEGGMFRTVPFERSGITLPMIAGAPPSLGAYFAHFCTQHADREFIVDGAQRLTFAEALAAARALAGGLIEGHGLQKGERVGLAARNSSNWIVAYMAVIMAGGCAVLLNGFWTGEELAEGIAFTGCRLVLADPQREGRLAADVPGAQVLPMRHDCPPLAGLASLLARGGGAETALPELTGDDHATLLFTSGSTAAAKAALSDHRGVVQATFNYVVQTLAVLGAMTRRGQAPAEGTLPVALVCVPLFHVTGEVPLFLQSFALGRTLVLMSRWDAVEAMRLIERERVTYFIGVPLMSFEIATHAERATFDLSSCLTIAAGGAPRPAGHVGLIRDALPGSFAALGYGLTETNAVGCGNFNENYLERPGSTGRPSPPLVEIAILDDDGLHLDVGATGEVAIRSVASFLGYWNDEEATRAAITPDGYFRTGDLGYRDEDGYLFIVDRKKDIVIRGGENIACIEVETAIHAHPSIAEVCVFGLPDERYGEIPVAVYRTKPGCSATDADLRAFLGGHIAAFKIPALLWQVQEPLPRLGTEKVDKRQLRDFYAKQRAETGNRS